MSSGLKAPTARGLARPAPVKKSGLARPTTGLARTPSAGNKAAGKLSGSREALSGGPIRSTSRGALRSASNQSINSGECTL